MNEILLLKYGELALKGLNKGYFEGLLTRELKGRLEAHGGFKVYRAQSTIYIEPKDENADMSAAADIARHVFGITGMCRACVVEKDMEKLRAAAEEYLPAYLTGARSFKVEAKRSDKRFPLGSPEIASDIGSVIYEKTKIPVDVHKPEVTVRVEIRDFAAYISAGQVKCAGGMPYGSAGKGLLLLSGGIDSPVAGYMMAKRGIILHALHFESYPYTSERALAKVAELAKILCDYTGKIVLHTVSVTKIQEELRRSCDEDYFTLLLRRSMMRIAGTVAAALGCGAIITGESLGQVASQTTEALAVTNAAVSLPVFRPCIGLDKEEIVQIARSIGTFETSILPYEDCCTVFTPKHPKTKPTVAHVEEQEAKLDLLSHEAEAVGAMKTTEISS